MLVTNLGRPSEGVGPAVALLSRPIRGLKLPQTISCGHTLLRTCTYTEQMVANPKRKRLACLAGRYGAHATPPGPGSMFSHRDLVQV